MLRPGELFIVPGYPVRALSQADIPPLQAFYEACADYSLLVDGYLPRPGAAVSLLTERPPEKSVDDKLLVGIYLPPNTLVGVLDVVKDYPMVADWWIGLLLLAPQYRGKGLGHKIFQSFRKWVIQYGAKKILLGVVETNENAVRFWQSEGFIELERQPGKIGDLSHIVITMEHEVHEAGID